MVKHHLITDRTFRYTSRSNKKFVNEINSEIKKKNNEISTLRYNCVENLNKFRRSAYTNNYLNKIYAEIYENYYKLSSVHNVVLAEKEQMSSENEKLKEENEKLKEENEKFTNLNSELTVANEKHYNKIKELNEVNKEIEDKYLSTLDDYNEIIDNLETETFENKPI